MPSIAVIDDDASKLTTAVRSIRNELDPKGSWQCLGESPLPSVGAYLGWLREKDVAVLVIDEKLADKGPKDKPPIKYSGHEVVLSLRKRVPTLPIFILTAFGDELEAYQKTVENILTLDNLAKDSEVYVARMMRAGGRYVESREKELDEMASLASKIAQGKASTKDRSRLTALQTKVGLQLITSDNEIQSERIEKMEAIATDVKEVVEVLRKLVKRTR